MTGRGKVIMKQFGRKATPFIAHNKIFMDGQYASGTTDMDNKGMVRKRSESEKYHGDNRSILAPIGGCSKCGYSVNVLQWPEREKS